MANEHAYNQKDAELIKTIALPAAAGAVNGGSIDLGAGDAFLAPCELEITTAALSSVAMPNTSTLKIDLQQSSDDGDSDAFDALLDDIISLTAADNAGIAAQTKRIAIPSNAERYLRVNATTAASAADCSGSNMVLSLLT